VFDSKLTTYAVLSKLDEWNITFITLRRRSPKLLAEIANQPRSAWQTVHLDVPHRKFKTPRSRSVEAMRELSEVRAIPVKIRSNSIWVRTDISGNAAKLFHAIGIQIPPKVLNVKAKNLLAQTMTHDVKSLELQN
jgi:hypothetical protein